jgi:hypothetical protein
MYLKEKKNQPCKKKTKLDEIPYDHNIPTLQPYHLSEVKTLRVWQKYYIYIS